MLASLVDTSSPHALPPVTPMSSLPSTFLTESLPTESDSAALVPSEASYLASLPVHFRLCVQLFVRLLESLQGAAASPASPSDKYNGMMRLIVQMPGMLASFPALSMASDRVFHGSHVGASPSFAGVTGILQTSLLKIYNSMMEDNGSLTLGPRSVVLSALLGLAVRQGSPVPLFKLCALLRASACNASTTGLCSCSIDLAVTPFMTELKETEPLTRPTLAWPPTTASSSRATKGYFLVFGGFPSSPSFNQVR